MSIAFMVFQKLLVLFLLMGMGCFLAQNILTKDVTRQLSKLLTTYVAPSLFVATFLKATFSSDRLIYLLITIAMAFFILIIRIILTRFLVPKGRSIDTYAVLFANVGFLGTPLALAVGGEDAVFYISGFVVANQIMQWTYGIYLITQDKTKVSLRSALLNPASISTAIGLVCFVLPFTFPTVLTDAVSSFAQLNTPLSTLVLGTYFYKVNWRDVFCYLPAYWTAFLRLIVTSLVSIVLIWLLPLDVTALKLALTIASCSPTAMNAALLSQVYGGDYQYGSRLVLLTTTLSLISFPIMMGVASWLYLG
ncbi:AEC family transporter [Streptococcus merionis]|uniref:AEC family transporter n=1 Tax=Streptococcus merionis TaxID=400065 RepID=UPI00351787BD